jgi:DnaJ-class molecular chaperone
MSEKEWTRIKCDYCAGHGQVANYGAGHDFYGAKECRFCGGSGHMWRSPKGRIAAYPGAPFVGRDR